MDDNKEKYQPETSRRSGMVFAKLLHHKKTETLSSTCRDLPLLMFSLIKQIDNAHNEAIWSVDFSRTSDLILTASVDESVGVWDAKTLEKRHSLNKHRIAVTNIKCLPNNGMTAVSSSVDGQVLMWDIISGSLIRTVDEGKTRRPWTIAVDRKDEWLACGEHNGIITLLPLMGASTQQSNSDHIITFDTKNKFIMCITFSHDSKYLACGLAQGTVLVYDIQSENLFLTLHGHTANVRCIVFSPDNKLLMTGGDDRRILVYDFKSQNLVASFSEHSSWVLSLAFHPNSDYFASGSADKTVKIWSLNNRGCIHTFTNHRDLVWGVVFNDDGSQLVSVSDDASLCVYSIKDIVYY